MGGRYQPHQERVIAEQQELQQKLDKLNEFMKGEIYAKLDQQSRELLFQQSGAMQQYNSILLQRIQLF